ncbi:hypothetical protein T02_2050 [Trichinella nativa]|uniref:Uncharacterized protein n=1 Tax=Trichinella nativa TaxID=6335 RepID=A0A0V1LME8_9BILA|nr:hypothetical protein T02_9886 [Trichinella nativa]KRZ60690.1 hypothetical protein T02_2050 [Trichinella nativa]
MHKNRFPALRYANNDHHKSCKVKKSENADDTKQITDRTKQNKRRQKLPKILNSAVHSIRVRSATVI